MQSALKGLYAVTRPLPGGPEALAAAVEQAIVGGAALVQYRFKGSLPARREAEAAAVLQACRRHGVPLIINDDVELARTIGADGVHLGADDASPADARRVLGKRALIGVSCYNQLQRAVDAQEAGAAYVAFGSFHPSPTKPNAVRAGPELLRGARARLTVPLCAIGGITPENGGELVRAGADLLAVVSGLFEAGDIQQAARNYAALFNYPPDNNHQAHGGSP